MISFLVIASFVFPLFSAAQLVPTAPGPGDVFTPGGQCSISWTADTSGKWKQTNIELMTGPNQQMVHLATVATVDGTDPTKTTTSIPCPGVTPSSAIYFYQFTAQGQNTTWTGRFSISDSTGSTVPPPNPKQPDGSPIPWGTGTLLDASQGSPPPSTAPPGQVDGSSGTASNGTSPSSAPSVSSATLNGTSSLSSSSVVTVTSSLLSPSSPSAVPVSTPSGVSTVRVSATNSATVSSSTSATATGSSPNSAAIHARSTAAVLLVATILGLVSLC